MPDTNCPVCDPDCERNDLPVLLRGRNTNFEPMEAEIDWKYKACDCVLTPEQIEEVENRVIEDAVCPPSYGSDPGLIKMLEEALKQRGA